MSIFKSIKNYITAIKVALLYENGKLSSGRLMLQFVFLLMNIFWISTFWISVNVPESMENVFYALLAYVFGTKGVNVAKNASYKIKKATAPTEASATQQTGNVDSPD